MIGMHIYAGAHSAVNLPQHGAIIKSNECMRERCTILSSSPTCHIVTLISYAELTCHCRSKHGHERNTVELEQMTL
jgi:hypothetical protein